MSASARLVFVLIAGFSTAALHVLAIVDQGMIPEFVVRDKALQDDQAGQMKPEAVAERVLRVSEAEQRAKRIHNLPPELVAAWAEGRVTEDELVKVSPERLPQLKPVKVSIPPRRLTRLVLAGTGALALGLLFVFQRRRAASPRPPQKRR